MNQPAFEARVLHLWMTTRVPMTRANLLFYTQLPRKRLDEWLDAMVGEGVLDIDADDDGEMVWSVRGARRPDGGATTLEALAPPSSGQPTGELAQRLQRLRDQAAGAVERSTGGLVRAPRVDRVLSPTRAGEKNVLAAGLLSFFFGPLGWLYAAPLSRAVPAIVLFMVAGWLLPSFLFSWLMMPAGLFFGLAGAAYAWRHNQAGERVPLLGDDDAPDLPSSRTPRRR